MDNLRKLATYGIQDEEKPPKKPHVTICVGQCHGQTNTNYVTGKEGMTSPISPV
jgi:hypothetical protein